jgi:DNA-binding NtrC family response regulator
MDTILIVDDEAKIRKNLSQILSFEGLNTKEASSGRDAIAIVRREELTAILLDLKMPDMGGLETMEEIKKINQHIPVIMITGHGDIPSAIEAMRRGAYDFITKPPDLQVLLLTIKKAIEKNNLSKKVTHLRGALSASLQHILGQSNAMQKIIDQLQQIAQSDYALIIFGETGTGKTFLANILHDMSRRSAGPFLKISIGSLPESLVESELFGHEKGAFTGAQKTKKGFFEAADRGTLFIDDIDNISPLVQGKLLHALEEKRIYHLGETKPVDVDVRIISATNKDLKTCIQQGKFREDLYFRLGEISLDLPPLRERTEDIVFFARKFLIDACADLQKQVHQIDADAINSLKNYAWPGNLRELKNTIKKAALFAGGDTIMTEHLHAILAGDSQIEGEIKKMQSVPPLKQAVRDAERQTIFSALEQTKGNKTRAAKLLSITYRSLLMKIKEYQISGE